MADGYDAPFYNPAGIGGMHWDSPKRKTARNLYFPLSGLSINQNSYDLYQSFAKEGGSSSSAVGAALVDAAQGERQYARATQMLGLGIGRTIVLPYMDQQGAAIAKGEDAMIDGKFHLSSGIGSGFSVSDPKGRFYLGAFAFSESRTTYAGSFDYLSLIDVNERNKEIKDSKYQYSAQGYHVGMIYRVPKGLQPSFALALRNAGDTTYKLKKPPVLDPEAQSFEVAQELTFGASISPKVGKESYWTWILEGHHLLHDNMDMTKKFRLGQEYAIGGFGQDAILALRAGYSEAGPSGGFSLNLGILNLEASVSTMRVGVDNQTLSETRGSVVLYIDVAE
jgi:hypothetical protein